MEETPPDEAPAAPSKAKVAIIAAVALLAGAGVGAKVVAPRLSPAPAATADAPAGGGHGGEKESKEPPKIFRLDNVIVHPAGSMGQRYMIVSLAFQVEDAELNEKLTRAEVQIRDLVIGLLEKKTLAELTQLGARDSLRLAIGEAVKPFLDGKPVSIYIPQFLIQ